MRNTQIILKVQPKLIRKSIPIKVVVQPNTQKTTNIQNIKSFEQRPQNVVVTHKSPIKQTNQTNQTKKKVITKHITRDPTKESISKINSLKNIGIGKILVIIGNGPTVNLIDTTRLKHEKIHILTINKPDMRVWPTTYWAFFDQSQLRRNEDIWSSYTGTIFNSTGIKKQKENSIQVKSINGKGFSRDLSKGVYIGRSSVYAALQIGYWLNYDKIYILGCDMDPDGINGQLHFYGTNPDVAPDVRKSRFRNESEHYDHAATILNDAERSRYTFCSSANKWPFVNRFNNICHTIAVDEILKNREVF